MDRYIHTAYIKEGCFEIKKHRTMRTYIVTFTPIFGSVYPDWRCVAKNLQDAIYKAESSAVAIYCNNEVNK
jgi:hypothetical protein